FVNLGQINPVWPGHASYPWSNTGATAYSSAPIWLGEFGTGNSSSDIFSTGAGSQGQWFIDLVNFVNSSYTVTTANNPGFTMQPLNWTYWSINGSPRRWTHSSASTSRVRLLCRMAVARANAAAPAHCRIRSDFVEPVWKLVWGGRPRPPFGQDAYLRAASRNALFRTRQSVGI